MSAPVIRVGLAGTGNWARYGHIPALQYLPSYEIAGVWSRRRENAEKVAREVGIPKVFTTTEELVADAGIDLVAILAPAPQHADIARAAIAAGKDVYCEWPLTTTLADSEDLLRLARAAGVRHIVGLQRRLGPGARYARDLIAGGYIGQVRSVRMHVSMEYFNALRPPGLAWTLDPANFSHILSIYGGHFLDLLFQIVGQPQSVSAVVEAQFPTLTLSETGESFPNHAPDEVAAIGKLRSGAVFTVQIEGGKGNNSGLQIDLTGMDGDLKISNNSSFGGEDFDLIEGAQGRGQPLEKLPVPESYHDGLSATFADPSVIDLGHLYAAHARDRAEGTRTAPDFEAAVRIHRFLDLISRAAETGVRQTVETTQS